MGSIAATATAPASATCLGDADRTLQILQVEQMYSKLVDESDRFRDEMGDINDNVAYAGDCAGDCLG